MCVRGLTWRVVTVLTVSSCSLELAVLTIIIMTIVLTGIRIHLVRP